MSQKKSEEVEKLELQLRYLFEHGVDLENRIIFLNTEIDEGEFSRISAAMSKLESDSRKPITLKIFSEGGSVYSALAIIGRLKASKRTIITEGYGLIASAATLILASGDKRRISQFASYMYHESSYDVSGRHSQVKAEVKHEDKMERQWAKWMAEFSKKPVAFYQKEGVGVDVWWSPEQLLEFGLVDEII